MRCSDNTSYDTKAEAKLAVCKTPTKRKNSSAMSLETLIKSIFFYVEISLDGYRHLQTLARRGALV